MVNGNKKVFFSGFLVAIFQIFFGRKNHQGFALNSSRVANNNIEGFFKKIHFHLKICSHIFCICHLMDWLITISAICSHYIRNLKKREKKKKKRAMPTKWWWELEKTEVEKSSSMPAVPSPWQWQQPQHQWRVESTKTPPNSQMHSPMCLCNLYLHTYLPTTYPTTISPHSDWVRWVSCPPTREAKELLGLSPRPPFLGEARKAFILFSSILYPNTEISLTEWEQEVWKEACERDIHQ